MKRLLILVWLGLGLVGCATTASKCPAGPKMLLGADYKKFVVCGEVARADVECVPLEYFMERLTAQGKVVTPPEAEQTQL